MLCFVFWRFYFMCINPCYHVQIQMVFDVQLLNCSLYLRQISLLLLYLVHCIITLVIITKVYYY